MGSRGQSSQWSMEKIEGLQKALTGAKRQASTLERKMHLASTTAFDHRQIIAEYGQEEHDRRYEEAIKAERKAQERYAEAARKRDRLQQKLDAIVEKRNRRFYAKDGPTF